MTLNWHMWTLATVIRAGDDTALVSLDDWHRGQILAPADSRLLQTLTGRTRHQLRGTKLWVRARVTALHAEDLDLQQWKPHDDAIPSRAA